MDALSLNTLIQCHQDGIVSSCEFNQMGLGRLSGTATPNRPDMVARQIVCNKQMLLSETLNHGAKHLPCGLRRDAPPASVNGHADKTKLRNGRGKNPVGLLGTELAEPVRHEGMMLMVRPPPGHEKIYVEQCVQGKSPSIASTMALVNVPSSAPRKISAPVRSQTMVEPKSPPKPGGRQARRRIYSDTLIPQRFAWCSRNVTSASLTLNVTVFMVLR